MKLFQISAIISLTLISLSSFSQTHLNFWEANHFEIADSIINNSKDCPADGICKSYYKSGELFEVKKLKNQRPHDTLIQYYKNGNIIQQQIFKDGVAYKTVFYYNNGQKKEEALLKGKFEYSTDNFWDSTGKQLIIKGNGYKIDYYKNGKLKEKGQLENYEKTGLWTYYYNNGNKSDEGIYVNNKQDSIWNGWNINGRTIYIEKYAKGNLIEGTNYSNILEICSYKNIEEPPYYPGRLEAYLYFEIKNNIELKDEYLLTQKENKKITISLMLLISKEGKVLEAKVMKSTNNSKALDLFISEALLKSGPWVPGKIRCKSVTRRVSLSIII